MLRLRLETMNLTVHALVAAGLDKGMGTRGVGSRPCSPPDRHHSQPAREHSISQHPAVIPSQIGALRRNP